MVLSRTKTGNSGKDKNAGLAGGRMSRAQRRRCVSKDQ